MFQFMHDLLLSCSKGEDRVRSCGPKTASNGIKNSMEMKTNYCLKNSFMTSKHVATNKWICLPFLKSLLSISQSFILGRAAVQCHLGADAEVLRIECFALVLAVKGQYGFSGQLKMT